MAKRFSATEIWDEDWFLDVPNEYKLFWYYMLSTCDHAGFYRVNTGTFCRQIGSKISSELALEYFNNGKGRIREITKSVWLIEDFFVFQYGDTMNLNSKVHESIFNLYKKYNINVLELRGLKEVKERTKKGLQEVTHTLKDKDKDIYTDVVDFKKIGLVPNMMQIFKQFYPHYPEDETNDYPACLSIAYKIAKQKGWMKESVVNGNMAETIAAWEKVVEFSISDNWYATRSVSDFNKEFQRIVQGMVQKNKVIKQPEKPQQTAPTLTYLTK